MRKLNAINKALDGRGGQGGCVNILCYNLRVDLLHITLQEKKTSRQIKVIEGEREREGEGNGNRNALGYVGRRRCVVQLVGGLLIFCGLNLAAGRGGWQPQPQFHLLWRRSRNLLINALIDSLTVRVCVWACLH